MTHRIGRLRRLDIAAVSVKKSPLRSVSCEHGLGMELTGDATVTTVGLAEAYPFDHLEGVFAHGVDRETSGKDAGSRIDSSERSMSRSGQ